MDVKGLFAGGLTGRYYFRDNWYCESALIALCQVINILMEAKRPLREMVKPLKRYARTGDLFFQCSKKADVIAALADHYSDASINYLEGITIIYEDWWFNVRPTDTDDAVRLNLEANNERMLEAKLAELIPMLGEPAEF